MMKISRFLRAAVFMDLRFLAVALCAVCTWDVARAAVPAASGYVQSGLINHWDGIENVGAGLPHDNNATEWKNLSTAGSNEVWHVNSHAEWLDYGLHFKGTGRVDGAGPENVIEFADGCATVEFVYSNEATSHSIIFSPNWDTHAYMYTDSAGHVGFYDSPKTGVAVPAATYTYFTVVYNESGGVKKFYVNNVETSNGGMNEWWSGTARCLGGRSSDRFAKGDLLSIRVYKGELSDADRTANYTLDLARFGQLAVGRTISAKASGGGLVSINSGTPASSTEAVLGVNEPVTVSAVDAAGVSFAYWRITRKNEVSVADKMRNLSFAVEKDTVLEAVFLKDSDDRRIAKYAMDGMIAMWDGISNRGPLAPHDDSATVWNDCVGDCDLTVNPLYATWLEKALDCRGDEGGLPASSTKARNDCQTIEAVISPPPARDSVILWTGSDSRKIAADPTAPHLVVGVSRGLAYQLGDAPLTVSFVYSKSGMSCYTNGVSCVSDRTTSVFWYGDGGVIIGGHCSGTTRYNCPCTVYAVRLYNRMLTEEELARNARNDYRRFFAPPPLLILVK